MEAVEIRRDPMLPNFLILGASKSGTTSLYHVFRRHPQILMAPRKEVHFFEKERAYRRGIRHYERFFAGGQAFPAVGEATPAYLCHPQAPGRIHAHVPDARLIVILRHPVDRAYSQYWYKRRDLAEPLTFEEALERDLCEVYRPGQRGYFSRGVYISYIRRYLELFPRERLLVLLFEDLARDPHPVYRRCFQFLEVDEEFECPEMERRYNRSTVWNNPLYNLLFDHPRCTTALPPLLRQALCVGPRRPHRYPPMLPETRARLLDFYRKPNEELAAFLGRDLSEWSE